MAAGVAILFNTALAWAKDMSPKLNDFLKSVAGHHWTTHGLADLAIFLALGFVLTATGATKKMDPSRVIIFLAGSVILASLGLLLWFAFV
jgi:hypothetical protein